jgi:hypothetical protein
MDGNPHSCARIEEILSAECEVVSVSEDPGADCSLLGDFDVIIQDAAWGPAPVADEPLPSRAVLLLQEDDAVPLDYRDRNLDDVLFRPVDRSEVLARVRLMGRKRRLMAQVLDLERVEPDRVEVRTEPEPKPKPSSGTFLRAAA